MNEKNTVEIKLGRVVHVKDNRNYINILIAC